MTEVIRNERVSSFASYAHDNRIRYENRMQYGHDIDLLQGLQAQSKIYMVWMPYVTSVREAKTRRCLVLESRKERT